MELNPDHETPGRKIVRHNGGALVEAMKMALAAGDPDAAQIVACDCVVVAETKDHANWELIGKCGQKLKGPQAQGGQGGVPGSRGPGRRAPLSQQGLVPRVVD